MLTSRQKRLLALLASADGWTTSAALAARLGVSDKLVKQEVAAIRAQLGGEVDIASRTRRGYQLVYLAPHLRAQLGEGLVAHEGHHSVDRRYALVYLCLLFQDGPLSTSQLAERLYSSRAAVADQLEIVRYRVERLTNVELAVSRRSGFKLQLCESERRHEASKWLRADCLPALFEDASAQEAFTQLMARAVEQTRSTLAPLEQAGRLSGEDVQRIGYYLALSVEHARTGHALGQADAELADRDAGFVSPAARDAAAELIDWLQREQQGFVPAACERPVLAALIEDSLQVEEPTREATALAEELADTAAIWLGGPERACSSHAKRRLACALSGLLRRMRRGHQAFNYHASETVTRYPFESCLATWFLRERVALPVPKAEMAFLALTLADVARELRPTPCVLLCTDEAPAFAQHLCQELARPTGAVAASIRTCAVDQADEAALEQADIVITTSGSFAARTPGVLLVSTLPGGGELRRIEQELAARRARARTARTERLLQAGQGASLELADISALAGHASELASGSPAVVLTAYRRLCVVEAGAQESSIAVAEPEHEIVYQHKRYREVVYARWGANDPDPYGFFEVLSRVLSGKAEPAPTEAIQT